MPDERTVTEKQPHVGQQNTYFSKSLPLIYNKLMKHLDLLLKLLKIDLQLELHIHCLFLFIFYRAIFVIPLCLKNLINDFLILFSSKFPFKSVAHNIAT